MNGMFHVGDVVRIRDWDDMAQEYGVRPDGLIDCPEYVFNPAMREHCGKQFTITSFGEGILVRGHRIQGWEITTHMIEMVNNYRENFNDDTSDIDSYLAEFNCSSPEIS